MTATTQDLSFLIIDASCEDNPLAEDRCFAFRTQLPVRKAIDTDAALEDATRVALAGFEKAGFFAETLSPEHLGLDAATALCVSSPSGQDAFKVARQALFNRFGAALMACGPFSLGDEGLSGSQRQQIADFLS